jgi:hypothetical protein
LCLVFCGGWSEMSLWCHVAWFCIGTRASWMANRQQKVVAMMEIVRDNP